MEGQPEGTGTAKTRPPRWMFVLAVIFVLYLIARLIQAAMWLSGKL